MVLDCCSKPSHDLGCQELFAERFGELKAYLLENRIQRVIVLCPNCRKVFSEYGSPLETVSVYDLLLQNGLPHEKPVSLYGPVTIHDPCVLRKETGTHQAVRRICHSLDLEVAEMLHSGEKTLCCGEGGSAGCLAPDLAAAWGERRKMQAEKSRIITYCAGCASALKHSAPVTHILDAVLYPDSAMAGRPPVSAPPFTYLHRLRLKRLLKRKYPDAHMHERQGRKRRRWPGAALHRLDQARRGLIEKLAGIAGCRKR
jgi:hypothetical protein